MEKIAAGGFSETGRKHRVRLVLFQIGKIYQKLRFILIFDN